VQEECMLRLAVNLFVFCILPVHPGEADVLRPSVF
jgi:hypothetical protein